MAPQRSDEKKMTHVLLIISGTVAVEEVAHGYAGCK